MKPILLLSILIPIACFQAKKSVLDLRTPSGGIFSILASPTGVSQTTNPNSETNSTIINSFTFSSPVRFFTKGTPQSTNPENASGFSNWTIQPALPSELTLSSDTGTIQCNCPTNMAMSQGIYTISAVHSTGKSLSQNIQLDAISPFQLLEGGSGINGAGSYLNGFPISHEGKLIVLYKQNNIHAKLWDNVGFQASSWSAITPFGGIGGTSADYPKAIVWNNKLYTTFAEANRLRLFRYDGTNNWTEIKNGANEYINIDIAVGIVQEHISMNLYSGKLTISFIQNNSLKVISFDGNNFSENTLKSNPSPPFIAFAASEYNSALFYAFSLNGSATYIAKAKADLSGFDSESQISYTASTTGQPRLIAGDNRLFLGWQEFSTYFQIRMKVFDGTNWTSIDGHPNNSQINYSAITSTYPSLVYQNGNVLVAFLEGGSLRAKVYTGSQWNSLGVGSNFDFKITSASLPRMTLFSTTPTLVWTDNFKVHARGFFSY